MKAFTLVSCNKYSSIEPGFIDEEYLEELEDLMYEIGSATESTELVLYYMMFLDYENSPVEDVTEEEINILNQKLVDFYESGYIDVVEVVKIPINIKKEDDDEIVELFY